MKYAAEHRKEDDYSAVWCVFDCDEHLRVSEARQRAKDCGIEVAFSNPCFELWFLLHFDDSKRHIERDVAVRECKRRLPNYSKAMDVYDELRNAQDTAIANAQRLRKHHDEVNECRPENPSTSVDLMVLALRELAASR